MVPIIPDLIDDLGRECLIRIPYQELPTATSVCNAWRTEISSPEFRRRRKAAGVSRHLIVTAQARSVNPGENPGHGPKDFSARPTYGLTLFDPGTGHWDTLPAIPGLPEGLPVFCGLVGSGSDLVVMGGWDPVTLRASDGVYIYSFLSGTWRRGSDMPGVRRSFFGCCASYHDRTVLVAGGHDEDKNALRSAMLYDVENDKWVQLPDMARERDECKVIFHGGKFRVISGYPTDTQGCFERTAEDFDPSTWQWGPVVEDFLEATGSPSSCVVASDGRVYACVGRRSGDVAIQQGERWQVVAKVPADVGASRWVTSCEDKVVVIGSSKFGEACNGYMLDLKNYKWNKIDMPKGYCGHVQCGCVLEL